MKERETLFRGVVAAGTALLLLAACDRPIAAPPVTDSPATRVSLDQGSSGGSATVNQELAELRQVTAQLRDTLAAKQAGWSLQVTNCMDDLPAGAMGYHFGNPDYMGDAVPDVRRPQLLMYEPEKNGKTRLVGIEYIVPYSVVPADADPPVLFGQQFHQNNAFGIWGLHAWVWQENPNGVFQDWNPKVTCDYAGPYVTHLGDS